MISIKKYSNQLINQWNEFVLFAKNGTLFANQLFLGYHIDKSFQDCSLLFYSGNKIVALLPAAIQNNTLYSHPGASYGGLILAQNLSFKTINDIICTLNKFCIKQNFSSALLISCPQTYFVGSDESLNYLLSRHQYSIKEQYISHIVNLKAEKNLKNLLTKRKQRYLNNSSDFNHLVFQESNSFDKFYQILFNSKKTYKTTPTHSLNELNKIKKLFPKNCFLILSILNSSVAGGTLMFFINKKVSLVFYNVVLDKFRNTQLSTFQLYNCMVFSKKRGYNFVDFGVSQNPEKSDPLSPKLSLIKFKEQFGARGAIRTVYEKEFNNG